MLIGVGVLVVGGAILLGLFLYMAFTSEDPFP